MKEEQEEKEKKLKKNLKATIVVATIIFIALTLIFLTKTYEKDFCGNEPLHVLQNNNLANFTTKISNNETTISQYIPESRGRFVSHELKLNLISEGDNEINIINSNETVKKLYVINGTNKITSFIKDITKDDYIGISCPTCNNTNKITLKQEVLGEQNIIIIKEGNEINVIEDEPLYIHLTGKKECTIIIKKFFDLWLWLLGLVFLIFGILAGYKSIKSIFWGDF